jgi:hypothetical protein
MRHSREFGETVDDFSLTFYDIFGYQPCHHCYGYHETLLSKVPNIRMATVVTFVTKVTMEGGSMGGCMDGSHCRKFPATNPSS